MLALRGNDPAEAERILSAARTMLPRTIQPWIAPGHNDDPLTDAGAGWPPIFQADDGGYYGDPAAATAETGRAILETIVSCLADFLGAFAATPLRLGASRDARYPSISAAMASNTHG